MDVITSAWQVLVSGIAIYKHTRIEHITRAWEWLWTTAIANIVAYLVLRLVTSFSGDSFPHHAIIDSGELLVIVISVSVPVIRMLNRSWPVPDVPGARLPLVLVVVVSLASVVLFALIKGLTPGAWAIKFYGTWILVYMMALTGFLGVVVDETMSNLTIDDLRSEAYGEPAGGQ